MFVLPFCLHSCSPGWTVLFEFIYVVFVLPLISFKYFFSSSFFFNSMFCFSLYSVLFFYSLCLQEKNGSFGCG